jgi:hypothetical protein
VYCGAGSETALSKQSKQVVIASSMTPMDVNDISSRPETTDTMFLKVAKSLTGKEGIPPR